MDHERKFVPTAPADSCNGTRTSLRAVVVTAIALVVTGCSTLPQFDSGPETADKTPRVSDIVTHIQCEIINAIASPQFDGSLYTAHADLTLDVVTSQSVNPALTYINPFATAGASFSALFNVNVSGSQHRTFAVSFTMLLDRKSHGPHPLVSCGEGSGLRGDLGIAQILLGGVAFEAMASKPAHPGLQVLGTDRLLTIRTDSAASPSFGSTIEFTLAHGGGGGPNWTLTHFTGPSLGTGLLSANRTSKDTLVLSFARVQAGKKPTPLIEKTPDDDTAERIDAINAAARAARDNSTRMILQRILPP